GRAPTGREGEYSGRRSAGCARDPHRCVRGGALPDGPARSDRSNQVPYGAARAHAKGSGRDHRQAYPDRRSPEPKAWTLDHDDPSPPRAAWHLGGGVDQTEPKESYVRKAEPAWVSPLGRLSAQTCRVSAKMYKASICSALRPRVRT